MDIIYYQQQEKHWRKFYNVENDTSGSIQWNAKQDIVHTGKYKRWFFCF